jgi:cytochrome c oxidase cbb3-type subunit II
MRIPVLFTGILATFTFAWFGQALIPKAQLNGLQPQAEKDFSDIYPVNNSGVAARGRQVYIAEGCYYCHTQIVRDQNDGADIDRGWGTRRTVARDYIYDDPAVLGIARNGPDLANKGNQDLKNLQWKDEPNGGKLFRTGSWLYAHLYNPRADSPHSIMPSYRYLFETKKIVGERSMDALDLKGDDAPKPGYEVVPSEDAKALVSYLLSLDRTHKLNEVKQEAPAK